MALTNYFLQIIAVDVATSDYTPGPGALSPALVVPGTLIFFAAQVLASRWRLGRFRYGPLE